MARRDDAEFTEFVRARSAALLRTAYLVLGDHALAQDLVQESLAKVYVAWPRIQRREGVEAYARATVVNTAISWRRRKGWYGERPADEVPEPRSPVSDEPDVRVTIWRTLQELPPRQRAALVLRFYEDLSIKETAQVMQCAEGTVKSQVSQGIQRLREALGSRAAVLGEPDEVELHVLTPLELDDKAVS